MIKGQKELERKFAALEQVCDQQMERLVGQQAKRIQAEAKLLCLSLIHISEPTRPY